MSEEELIETLKSFEEKRVEQLPENARNIFYAIMKIADERDFYKNIVDEAIEYVKNNSLYEQDYDYDYEENLVEYPPSDETARKQLLEILDKENNNDRKFM